MVLIDHRVYMTLLHVVLFIFIELKTMVNNFDKKSFGFCFEI